MSSIGLVTRFKNWNVYVEQRKALLTRSTDIIQVLNELRTNKTPIKVP